MKVVRFELHNSPGQARAGFVDLDENCIVDAGVVLAQAGIEDPLHRALDIIVYNTDNAGSLSHKLEDLDKFNGQRWGLDDVKYLPCIEAGSLRDFIAFEEHIKTMRSRRGIKCLQLGMSFRPTTRAITAR